jgi:hypothetical protein
VNRLSQSGFDGRLQQLSGGPTAAKATREVTAMSTGAQQGRVPAGATPQELAMVCTRVDATRLAVELVRDPFAPETVAAAQEFLSGAEAAGEAFAELQSRPEHEVCARIRGLTAGSRGGEASS